MTTEIAPPVHPVGQTLYLTFDHTTGVTGWTVELIDNATGNQATTGVTVSEPDSTNNEGVYVVTCNGSTSFVGSAGQYALKVYETATPANAWLFRVDVRQNDLNGAASFTATASDGRITDGTNPLDEARVYLTGPNGQRLLLTTDASGLWGPVWLENGTWTIYAQKSGYAQGVATITVSGGTATGPASDVELSALSNSSTITAATLWSYARRTCADATGEAFETEMKRSVNLAVKMLASLPATEDYTWWDQRATVTLETAYTTGTVAISGTTVTLTGGTFPSWAADGVLLLKSERRIFEVSTRDSDTQLTLGRTAGTVASGTEYILAKIRYTLPTAMMRLIAVDPGRDGRWELATTNKAIFNAMSAWRGGTVYTDVYAVEKDELMLWGWPTDSRDIEILYRRMPADLTASDDTADIDTNLYNLLLRCIDYQLASAGIVTRVGTRQDAMAALVEAQAFSGDEDRLPEQRHNPLRDDMRPSRYNPLGG